MTATTDIDTDIPAARIRDDDELINFDETLPLIGGISISTAYNDPALMALKIDMSAGAGPHTKIVRFIKREILALRAERVARSEAKAANVRAKVIRQRELREERRRARTQAKA
jgi:hypothetical protein